MLVYTARYLLPVSAPIIRDGALAVDQDRVQAVGSRSEVMAAAGEGAEVRDLGDVVVFPGLVNAHTRLDACWMGTQRPPGGDYLSWLATFLDRRSGVDERTGRAAAEAGLAQMAARGTVAVADVANEMWIGPLIARSGLRAVVFHELYGLRGDEAESLLASAAAKLDTLGADPDLQKAAGRVRVALTPHSPHTTSAPLLRALAGRSTACGDPLTIHVAESAAEISLLRDGSGPLADLFRERGLASAEWQPPKSTPVGYLHRTGILSPRMLAVHCVHLDRQDRSLLQAGRVTVVTCPRSNRYLDVGTAPIPKLLGEGVPVALGTGSLASAPDLDLFAEMAALLVEHPGLSPAAVLRMATLNGARALGLHTDLGSIEAGKLAALNVLPLDDPGVKPFEAVCANPADVYPLAEAPWSSAP
jgi:cytosine/adenosine deaminase-related metal-dependent hydrolase